VNGITYPGILFKIVLNTSTDIDRSLTDVLPHMKKLFNKLNVSSVDVIPDYRIVGRSWEMAAVMCALGYTGTFSGVVDTFNSKQIQFGSVSDIPVKRQLDEDLVTHEEVPSVLFP
jgi:hypothetical protein